MRPALRQRGVAQCGGHCGGPAPWLGGGRITGGYGEAFKNRQARDEFESLCEEKNAVFIPKAQIKWYGFPKLEIVKQLFHERKFDMVISVCPVSDFTVEYLAAGLRSNFKTGMCEPQWCSYSFVLEKGHAAPSVVEYLSSLLVYMRKMSQK